jgi:hypothetical protein
LYFLLLWQLLKHGIMQIMHDDRTVEASIIDIEANNQLCRRV